MNQTTEQLLAERRTTHGEYSDHARCTQNIMRAMMSEKNWDTLSDIQKESMHMFAHKMGRIATGDPDIHDHWDDIAGYAKLVSDRIPRAAPAASVRATEDTETLGIGKFIRDQIEMANSEIVMGGGLRQAMYEPPFVSRRTLTDPPGVAPAKETTRLEVRQPIHPTHKEYLDICDRVITHGSMTNRKWYHVYESVADDRGFPMLDEYITEYAL